MVIGGRLKALREQKKMSQGPLGFDVYDMRCQPMTQSVIRFAQSNPVKFN